MLPAFVLGALSFTASPCGQPARAGCRAYRSPPLQAFSSAADAPADLTKYGGDPRGKKGDANDTGEPWEMPSSGSIGRLESVAHLESALEAAADGFTVIKFMRPGCAACAATEKDFAKSARTYAPRGSFFLVNYDDKAGRAFCRQCAVKFVPCAHVYQSGSFVAAMPLGKKSWDAFAERLTQL